MSRKDYDVMISYSSKREQNAKDVYDELVENCKYKVWMAPNSIPFGSDYSHEIYKGIENSRVVVFIMSKESLESEWCNSELKQAASLGIEILPVLLDDDDDPYTKLAKIHEEIQRKHIYKAFPDYEKKIKGIKESIQNLLKNSDEIFPKNSYGLYDPSVVGREEEAEHIYDLRDKNHYKINIYGVGGIGKTYVIRKFITKYSNKTTILTKHMIKYEKSIKATIASIPFKNFDDDEYFSKLKNPKITKENALYEHKMAMLKKLGCACILFIDGADYIDKKEIEPLLSLPTTIIIASRNKYELDGLETYEIDKMSVDDCKTIFFNNSKLEKNEENEKKVEQVIELVDRHTFSINLLSKQIAEGSFEIDYLLKDNDNIIHSLTSYDKKGDISKIIDKAKLTKEELNVLKFFSFFKNGLTKGRIQTIHRDLIPILEKLAIKGLVSEDFASFQIHQIVRETILYNYEIQIEDISTYMEGFLKTFRGLYSRKIKITPIMEDMLTYIKGDNLLMADMYNRFAYSFNDFGYFELYHISEENYGTQDLTFHTLTNENSINFEYFEKCEKFQRKAIDILNKISTPEAKKKLSISTSSLGSSYFNRNMFEEAYKWQIKAYKQAKKYNTVTSHPYKVALDRIAKTGVYTHNSKHFWGILHALNEQEKISYLPDSKEIKRSIVYYEKGNLFKQYKMYNKALKFYNKSIEESVNDPKADFGKSEILLRKAEIYKEMKQPNLNKAKECYLEAKLLKEKILDDKEALKEFIEKYDKIYL